MITEMLLYKNSSESGRALAEAVGINFESVGRNGTYNCINWGSGDRLVATLPRQWLNTRQSVAIAQAKDKALAQLSYHGVNTPDTTVNIETAKGWCNDGHLVYCRTLTRANQGRGIVLAEEASEVVVAPFYTKQVNADREYRIHVFQGNVLAGSRKVAMDDYEGVIDFNIKNHDRGWKFRLCETNRIHSNLTSEAVQAVKALDLDFGAVDLCWNTETHVATILEVNTAPRVEGTIMEAYVNAFKGWVVNPDRQRNYTIKYNIITPREVSITASCSSEAHRIFTESLDDDDNVDITFIDEQGSIFNTMRMGND